MDHAMGTAGNGIKWSPLITYGMDLSLNLCLAPSFLVFPHKLVVSVPLASDAHSFHHAPGFPSLESISDTSTQKAPTMNL